MKDMQRIFEDERRGRGPMALGPNASLIPRQPLTGDNNTGVQAGGGNITITTGGRRS
jgi:hypothetical protein